MPGPRCSICCRPDEEEINVALRNKESAAKLALRFEGASVHALNRHRKGRHHFLAGAVAVEPSGTDGVPPLEFAMAHRDRASAKQLAAESRRDEKGAAVWAVQARLYNQQMAELLGEIDTGTTSTTVNVAIDARRVSIVQTTVLAALAPFPDARLAVAQALEAIEQDGG